MKKGRREHSWPDGLWSFKKQDDGSVRDYQMLGTLLMDLRAVLHDMKDEHKETNRILRLALGIEKEADK